MAAERTPTAVPDELRRLDLPLGDEDRAACCAALYEHPGVRWLLGGELHPGGQGLTRRAFELLDLGPDDSLLDVASGDAESVILAAAERGCRATGVEYGEEMVAAGRRRADERGLADRVRLVRADAGSLPFPDGTFDAVLSECALCLFADKPAAISEIRRVLRPGGRVAISDVVAEVERLPAGLRGELGAVACVGEAIAPGSHRELLSASGFEVGVEEDRSADALAMADRITDRLRGAKVLGIDSAAPIEGGVRAALELAAEARAAILDGRIGYTLISAAVSPEGA